MTLPQIQNTENLEKSSQFAANNDMLARLWLPDGTSYDMRLATRTFLFLYLCPPTKNSASAYPYDVILLHWLQRLLTIVFEVHSYSLNRTQPPPILTPILTPILFRLGPPCLPRPVLRPCPCWAPPKNIIRSELYNEYLSHPVSTLSDCIAVERPTTPTPSSNINLSSPSSRVALQARPVDRRRAGTTAVVDGRRDCEK